MSKREERLSGLPFAPAIPVARRAMTARGRVVLEDLPNLLGGQQPNRSINSSPRKER